ncbi:HEPN domain-containing protein [Pseudovibrio sp. Alg231-02]|uniref:HEPN domain-containing protein n=1 Tax=Pseudovibrio sp. Alg231-02 TaxID=1922223 RepID=UPI000D55FB52|nr:HEPN domain-containing protein [Pseudovibrio sp. Alg231-02]
MFWDDECNKLKCQIGETGYIKTLPSSNVFWRVNANASPENLKEEALWSINVTLSLIRIFGTDWSVMYPQSLDLEKDPVIEDRDFGVDPLIMTKGNIRIPGQKRIGIYEISAKSLPLFKSEWFQQIAIQLSEAKEKTLAYRVRDALGWMGRGRLENDRALRLLFFFTAIEAMLSSEDKGAPVTDTIARYGSIIISLTKNDRLNNYEWIKKLYNKRSETVHRGLRNSLWGHSIEAQEIAEVVAWQILEKCDLTQEYSQFHKDLKKASFGSDWEPNPSTLAKPDLTHA